MQHGKLELEGTVQEVLTDPKVLELGGQLPQVVLYFLELMKRTGKVMKEIPLTVEQAYQAIKEEQK